MQQATQLTPSTQQKHPNRLLFRMITLILVLALSPYEAKAATDCSAVTQIPVAECQALVALYNSTNGPNWVIQEGWLVTDTPCSWFGVECTSGPTSEHVTALYLNSTGLSGGIPPEFGNLSSLQFLNLSSNQLSSLPAEFGNLASLQSLTLWVNQLSSLPAAFGSLSSLQSLGLSYNQLSSLPAEFGDLSSLSFLQLDHNQLSSLPAEFGNLSSLQQLYLHSNPSLAGPLPVWLLHLSLDYFHFHDTNLCEPGDVAFQSWLDTIGDRRSTNVICAGTGSNTMTIILETEPNSVQDFAFSGDLGSFSLDNSVPDDGDTYTQTQTFEVSAGVYTVTEQVPGNWLLTGITCDPAASAAVEPADSQVMISLATSDVVTCTFANRRTTEETITFVKAVVGGTAQPSDWSFDVVGMLQDIPHNGQVHLAPGTYTVTEDGGPQNNANYALTAVGGACSLVNRQIILTIPDQPASCVITNTLWTGESPMVTTLEDELNSDGDCSLREAITAANDNAVVDNCSSGRPGADTISFSITGTIFLSDTLPTIEEALTLNGPGATDLTINGKNTTTVLRVATDTSVTLHSVTIGEARRQTALENNGTLVVTNTIFVGNGSEEGGGIDNRGTLVVIDSIFHGNDALDAGAILNTVSGTLTVINSSFTANVAFLGGAIFNAGALTVTNSTFANNVAREDKWGGDAGSAIFNTDSGTLTMINSTLGRNISHSGRARALHNSGQVELINTIIADNVGGDCMGNAVISLGHNLDSDGSCNLTAPGDIPNGIANLAAAAMDNGGPTLTLDLWPVSDAIDAGNNVICAAAPTNNQDQRGSPRPIDGDYDGTTICDIGAYEQQQTTQSGTITIVKDSLPKSRQDFRFSGDLGSFRLDNSVPDDSDVYTQSMTVMVDPGLYTVREQVPGNWVLSDITCDPPSGLADLANNQVRIALPDGNTPHVTCTIDNQRRSMLRAVKYLDSNGDARQNWGEPPLSGWQILLYDSQGTPISTTHHLTNEHGKVSFTGLRPGDYTVCEQMQDGWINTQPGFIDPAFDQPCYALTIAPGKIVQVYFGNVHHPVASAAQSDSGAGIVVMDAPDLVADEEYYDAIDTDEAWLNAPSGVQGLFLPLVIDNE